MFWCDDFCVQEPQPLLDLRQLKDGSPVALNLPPDVQTLRQQHKLQHGRDLPHETDFEELSSIDRGKRKSILDISHLENGAVVKKAALLSEESSNDYVNSEDNCQSVASSDKGAAEGTNNIVNEPPEVGDQSVDVERTPSFRVTCSR